ncbi:MAG: nuclear transport factor 2 family protein [Bacteroidetes bacterium]|nr:nuclear transport factor 2 family protein [Bacteroidota bacterium]
MHKATLLLSIFVLFISSAVLAQSADEKIIADRIEKFRKAMLPPVDKATLEDLTAKELSYCHSSGFLEDKTTFVEDLVKSKWVFTSISLSDQTIKIAGDAAIVRHRMTGETNNNNVPAKVDIIVLQVWQKQNGSWKLLARQAAKIPADVK